MAIPKVFISYSHDSIEHKKWVLDLATRLMHNSIDVILDQWELKPGDDLTYFMENSLREATKVLMICTENYVKKANTGMGGVGYEKMIITSDYLKNVNESKVIPVIRQEGSSNVPTFLNSKLYLPFSSDEDFEYSFDELIRTILDAPRFPKPKVGNNPFSDTRLEPASSKKIINELLRLIAKKYNEMGHGADGNELYRYMGVTRILFDLTINEALEFEYITMTRSSMMINTYYYDLTNKGKQYCVKHELA